MQQKNSLTSFTRYFLRVSWLTFFSPPILYALRTVESLWFSDVLRGYRNESLG